MPEALKAPEVIVPRATQTGPVPVYTPVPAGYDSDFEKPPTPLSHYIWILRRQIWKILAFVVVCMLATAIVSARLQSIFEATATIDVDRQVPVDVVGQDASRAGVSSDIETFMTTQIRLIQSDAVLRPVAEEFHLLDTEGQLSKLSSERQAELREAPVALNRLKVTRPPNTFLLLINYRSPDKRLAARVANAIANSYLKHTYDIRIRSSQDLSNFMQKELGDLQAKMEKSGQALAVFEKELDVVNPEDKTNILSARLLQLNNEYTTAQADRVTKQAAFNAFQTGSLEAAQVSSQGSDAAKLNDALNAARQHFALARSTYGPTHPEYVRAATELAEVQKQFDESLKNVAARVAVEYHQAQSREEMLQKTVEDTKAEWDHLNSRYFEYQQLKRAADTDKTLYDELIRKIRESDINSDFKDNSIRLADLAKPSLSPVYPNIRQNLLIAFLFSVILAIGAAFLYDAMDTTLRDPSEVSRYLGTDVVGALPSDQESARLPKPSEMALTRIHKPPRNGNRNGYYTSTSRFEETVRTIRNTIFLSDFDRRLRSIVLTSAAPHEGKTTLAAHLAIANADHGKKTLLVDGDLRRPSVHTKFGMNTRQGLSNVLTGEMSWRAVTEPVAGSPNLSILTAGPGSHRAADLIGPRLSSLLDEFAKEYDLVILDSPPLLGFAECLQMAAAADGVLIVSHAGETRRRAVADVVNVLNRLRANVIGVVLNKVTSRTSADGYAYYGYYRYGYERKNES